MEAANKPIAAHQLVQEKLAWMITEIVKAQLLAGHPPNTFIVQEIKPGLAASVAFLVGPNHCISLPPAAQHLSLDGDVKYLGGHVPLSPEIARRAETIARQAIEGIPGAFGYMGVDVVLGEDGQDWAIEINPRLTTSYVGLRELAETNLAEIMLAVVQGQEPPALHWCDGVVDFRTDGQTNLRT